MIYVLALAVMIALRFFLRDYSVRNKRIFTVVSCLLLLLISTLRDVSVGVDTASFCGVFSELADATFSEAIYFNSWTEPGFRVLCALIGFFTNDPQWLIIISSLLIHIGVSVFIYRHSKNVYLSFFLYMTLMLYPFYLNIMRQAMAIAIWLLAYDFLKKKKLLPYFLLVLLATTFHSSAALFLLCPLLYLVPVNRKTLSILMPATLLGAMLCFVLAGPLVSLMQALFTKYEGYEATSFDALYLTFAVFFLFAFYGMVRLYFTSPIQDPAGADAKPCSACAAGFDEQGFFALLMLIGCLFGALMLQFGVVQRVFNYFEVLYIIWIPLFLPPSDTVTDKRHIGLRPETLAIGACCLCYFAVILFWRSEQWYAALPYTFFWQ